MSITGDMIARVRSLAGVTIEEFGDSAIEVSIAEFPRPDADGYEPSDSDWTPTYDLFRAAADIVDQRAATAAGLYDFDADGAKLSRSQISQQLNILATRLRAKAAPRWCRIIPDETEDDAEKLRGPE